MEEIRIICYVVVSLLRTGNLIAICILAFVTWPIVKIIFEETRSAMLLPKAVKRRLPVRPLRRRRNFRPHDNPTKKYRSPHPDMVARAEARRAQQLAAEWPAEMAVKGILHIMGETGFEHQVIIYVPGEFLIADFFDHKRKRRIEVDGGEHGVDYDGPFDDERDKWLLRNRGIKTLRIANCTALRNPHACQSIIKAWLDS